MLFHDISPIYFLQTLPFVLILNINFKINRALEIFQNPISNLIKNQLVFFLHGKSFINLEYNFSVIFSSFFNQHKENLTTILDIVDNESYYLILITIREK